MVADVVLVVVDSYNLYFSASPTKLVFEVLATRKVLIGSNLAWYLDGIYLSESNLTTKNSI